MCVLFYDILLLFFVSCFLVIFVFCFVFFFFQAEDGIRDAQESRGLGDVYKRQIINSVQLIIRLNFKPVCGVFTQKSFEHFG